MQPIYLEIPRPINNSIYKAINIALQGVGLYAEKVEENNQYIRVEITHELDGMEIADAMEDIDFEVAIYEGYPKSDLSNKVN